MKTFFLSCFIAVGSLALQAHAVPLPDDEIMVGLDDSFYTTVDNEMNTTEEISDDDTITEAILYATSGKSNESKINEGNADTAGVEKIVTKIIGAMGFPMSLTSWILNTIENGKINVSSSEVENMVNIGIIGTNLTGIDSSEIDKMVENAVNSTNFVTDLMEDDSISNYSNIDSSDEIEEAFDEVDLPNSTEDTPDIFGMNLNSSDIDDMVNKVINSMNFTKLMADIMEDAQISNGSDIDGSNETEDVAFDGADALNVPNVDGINLNNSKIEDSLNKIMDSSEFSESFAGLIGDASKINGMNVSDLDSQDEVINDSNLPNWPVVALPEADETDLDNSKFNKMVQEMLDALELSQTFPNS